MPKNVFYFKIINQTCIVPTVVVPVADPDTRNAFIVVALVLVLRTNFGRTVDLVLASRTVLVVVALLVRRKTEAGHGGIALALELLAQAGVVVTILKLNIFGFCRHDLNNSVSNFYVNAKFLQ
jgi:hypothetical protein